MPQVKIKQGTKSSINNNAGVLNAGTLAITTDTNELFVTHNDGTVHQLCDNVNKSGDTMTGNLNMSGNSFENAGFEVVTSLPTANNFVGRRVTYQGKSYIWDGSAWKCDSDYLEIGGRNYIPNSEIKTLEGWYSYGSTILSIDSDSLRIVGNATYVYTNVYTTEFLRIDEEMTLCFEIKNNKANSITSYFWVNGNYGIEMVIPGNSGWVRFNETFIPDDYTIEPGISYITIGSYGDSDFQIRNVKLEKGNIATDWTPAPEDKANVDHDHDADYLGISAQATDSDKLDGKHLSDVVNGTTNYISKFTSANTIGNSEFYEKGGLLFGNIPLSPNLINNSWMNRVSSNGSPEGFIPATPMSGATLITQAVNPLTKGFEGCYQPSFDSSYMVSDVELATETNPMWYGQYYTGLRTTLGGLRNGWGSYGGGNIMKVSGSGFVKGTPFRYMGSFVTMKTDANQMGAKWIFSCWVKLVKGVTFAVGGDAGYYTTGPYPNSVSKTTTDASPQGWYLHKVIVATSQISNISAQIMALAVEPDSNGEIEAYIALPYLAVSNTEGAGNHSWTNSVLDRLWDKGIQIDLINNNVYFPASVQSNETINFDTITEPNETGTKTKTSTTLWQNIFSHTNFLWGKLKDLFTPIPLSVNDGYLTKIDDVNKKLVKSNINDNGSRISLDKPLRVNSKTFYNVAQYNTMGNETGTIYIEMPFGWSHNMGTYEIDVYNHSDNTEAKIIISGYNHWNGFWVFNSLQILGNLISSDGVYGSNVVRLGYNTNAGVNKCCILIGITSTIWSYPQVYVSKVTQGFNDTTDWSAGWSISIIDAAYESANITNIVQPTANVGMMLDGKTLTQQIADNNLRYLGLTAKANDSDKLDGYHAGNADGNIPINNGIKNVNLYSEFANKLKGDDLPYVTLADSWDNTKQAGIDTYRYGAGLSDQPPGTVDNANFLLNIYSHRNGGIGTYGYQLAGNTDAQKLYFRTVQNGSFVSWIEIWHSNNFDPTTKLDTTTINGTQNYLTKYGATGITQSNIFDNGTNVGIGTTLPVNKLEVDGSDATTFEAGGFYNTFAYGDSNKAEARINIGKIEGTTRQPMGSIGAFPNSNTSSNRGNLAFYTRESQTMNERMRINYSGNVGIGTSNPVQQLDITGSFNLPYTTPTQNGVIYKSNIPFIHNFNYGNNGTVTTEGYNTFLGINAGNFTMGSTASATYHSSYNIGIGVSALQNNTTGSFNSAIGVSALASNTTGSENSAIGVSALASNTTGNENSAIGMHALQNNTTGFANSAIGARALQNNTTGVNNSAIGVFALSSNTTGVANSAIGVFALSSNTTGIANSAIGLLALSSNTTGYYNSAIGMYAGRSLSNGTGRETGNYGLYLGYDSKASANETENEIVIGANAIGKGSNTATYGNSSMVKHIFEAGNVGIGTNTPSAKLEVAGIFKVSNITDGYYWTGQDGLGTYFEHTGNSINNDKIRYQTSKSGDLTNYSQFKIDPDNGFIFTTLGTGNGNVGIGTTTPSEKLHVDGNVTANGYKVGSGTDTKLLTDGGGTKLITDFATENTKNTAGATNTSSKIYLVGSTDQTANPQTYTHDTAYVDVDGSVYSGSSKTITVSDLETNQIITPTLNPTWTIKNYAGTAVSSPTNPSGGTISGTSIILEYGFKPSMTVKGKWVTQVGYDNPTSCSGLCGTSLPASNVETASTVSIDLYNSATYSSTTVPITTSDYWTISTPKKGITISGSSLVLPIGNISASARVQVTYQLPIYYGNVGSLTIIETTVEGLSTKTWKNYHPNSKSVSATINATDSEYWIYAYPAAWGDLSTISNADGDWIAAFTSSTVNITGAPGLPVLYKYYITVNKGAFKNKTINFS